MDRDFTRWIYLPSRKICNVIQVTFVHAVREHLSRDGKENFYMPLFLLPEKMVEIVPKKIRLRNNEEIVGEKEIQPPCGGGTTHVSSIITRLFSVLLSKSLIFDPPGASTNSTLM